MVKNENGVTLIELMVVVTIIALMSTIAFASYAGTQRQANVDTLHARVFALLETAKAEAALQSETVGCNFFSNGTACFTLVPGADRTSPTLNFTDGLITPTGDVQQVIGQERYNELSPIDSITTEGVFSSTTGLIYFRSDSQTIDGSEEPADFFLRLQSHEVEGAQAALRIRSTGSIVKEL